MKALIALLLAVLPLSCNPTTVQEHQQDPLAPSTSQCTGEHRDEVNAIPFASQVLEHADRAFRLVAADCGYSPEEIEAWVPFAVYDLINGESTGCPNVRGGAKMAEPYVSCAIKRQGKGSDSGFGQLISVHYRYPNGWICQQEWLCSSDALTANAYDSMKGPVLLIARSGKQSWCYNAKAISWHPGCKTAPKTPPTLWQD